MWQSILIFVHVFVAAGIIFLILMQQGKGADAGAAFGAGASGTVFGAKGSSNFLSRVTGILATVFFATSLTLAYFQGDRDTTRGVMETLSEQSSDLPLISAPPADDANTDLPALPQGEPVTPAPAADPTEDTPQSN